MSEPTGHAIFSTYIPVDAFEQPNASLAELSGYRMEAPRDLRNHVMTTVEKA